MALVDARGTGASLGVWRGPFSPQEATDTYDVTEWLAEQPWCTGAVGRFGRSYLGDHAVPGGRSRPAAPAGDLPGDGDVRSVWFRGTRRGVPPGLRRRVGRSVEALDQTRPPRPVPGHEDLLADALAARQANHRTLELFGELRFRDSEHDGLAPFRTMNPASYLAGINRSGIAVHHLAGWHDVWVRDALIWFRNLRVPQRLTIGPWAHTGDTGIDLGREHLRWYDHFLRGIDTGVMDEPPVRYFRMGVPAADPGARSPAGTDQSGRRGPALPSRRLAGLCGLNQ